MMQPDATDQRTRDFGKEPEKFVDQAADKTRFRGVIGAYLNKGVPIAIGMTRRRFGRDRAKKAKQVKGVAYTDGIADLLYHHGHRLCEMGEVVSRLLFGLCFLLRVLEAQHIAQVLNGLEVALQQRARLQLGGEHQHAIDRLYIRLDLSHQREILRQDVR